MLEKFLDLLLIAFVVVVSAVAFVQFINALCK